MKIIVDVDNFARTVEDICDAADMSCFNLCEKAGLGKNVAYPWLNGKARPQLYVFSKFAEAAGFRVVLEEVTE
jgi:DNA-binding phage protein